MMRVAILMTVFNRRELTLACLRCCDAAVGQVKAEGKYSFSFYLTDDGSTDGTAGAVSAAFPDVHIIKGSGSLFWNRGMNAAWEAAAKGDYDFYLWLNNDTMVSENAFSALLENSSYLRHRAIVVGTAAGSDGTMSYGGRMKDGRMVAPDKEIPVPCDIFNGNLVLVPKAVYEALGMLEPRYSHSFGDFDYGVRARKKGINPVVAPGTLAVCDRNGDLPEWRNSSHSLRERYRILMSPKGRPFREQFLYDARCRGTFFAAVHFLSLNFKVLFPKTDKKTKRPPSQAISL